VVNGGYVLSVVIFSRRLTIRCNFAALELIGLRRTGRPELLAPSLFREKTKDGGAEA